ncbi:right-handed parallel beta-helix repeat-containing protein, partial [bacterium]|nr:right-handed parallel beta-helix repeat-containing protein [bacterium]
MGYEPSPISISISEINNAYYVDATNGNDDNNGLSDVTAWKTITKVNLVNFASGDIIKFKRGEIWTDATLTLDGTSRGRSDITVEDYGTGDKPRIDGNSVRPILINHALVDLTLKNIDISGSDTSGTRCQINNVNGIVIDGIDYNGHTGSSSYVRSSAMGVGRVDGDIEIKNCIIQNAMKDTFANTLAAWGSDDAAGLIMYYAGDENVKSSGTVSIHDNVIHDIYSDCLQLAGLNTTTNVYDNELYSFGENAIDMKHSKHIDFYRNTVYQNDYGAAGGSGWRGPSGIVSGGSTNWVTFRASDNVVRENYIHTSKYTAIQTPGTNAIIKNNYIKNCFMGVSIANTGAKVYNNVFELTTGKPTVEPYASRWTGTTLSGIRVDQGAKTSGKIFNNTFYITSSDHLYGIGYHPDTDVSGIEIKNNIIYMTRNSSSVYPLYVQNVSGDYPTVSHNNFYGVHSNRVYWKGTVYNDTEQADWQTAGHTGSLFTDPLLNFFGNYPSPYFELQSGSPAIDAGIDVSLPFSGSAPDIGAYEYGGTTPQPQNIIDNGDPGTSSTGTWQVSGGPGHYGTDSLYSHDDGSTYTYTNSITGDYEISLWWTEWASRSDNVAIEIRNGSTLLETVHINQQTNGGQWNILGTYNFTGTANIIIISTGGGASTCADATRFEPSAIIPDTTSPVVNNFTVSKGSAIINWNVSDSGGSHLDRIEIWRAPDNSGTPGAWAEVGNLRQTITSQNTDSHTGNATDNPSDGTYWYGLHAVDQAGNM